MPYATADARRQLLDTLAEAVEHLGVAIAALSEAYEVLDHSSAERMEESLFGPVQQAYARARRAHTGFAERHDLPARVFEPAPLGAPGGGAKGFLESASHAVSVADATLGTLQDSMLPVEVGDEQLRNDLAAVRLSLDGVGARTRELLRVLGR